MARGRMLNRTVCGSLKFHNLPDETCRLLATWVISHLDYHGVFYGDPMMVKSIIFPRRADVTVEQVESYLDAMEEIGLIKRFDANGDRWQWWPGFTDNQPGLRAEREKTTFPAPPFVPILQDGGKKPQDGDGMAAGTGQDDDEMSAEDKLSEVKRKEIQSACEENPETAEWIADLVSGERRTAPADPPHSAEELRQRVLASEGKYFASLADRPWLTWGANHSEMKPRNGVDVENIQQVGYLLENEFGMKPLWSSASRTKHWLDGLAELHQVSEGQLDTIAQAHKSLRASFEAQGKPFNATQPQSLYNTVSGLMATARAPVEPPAASTGRVYT